MRFTILGAVEAEVDDRVVPIERPRRRAVLAYLLLSANRVVSTDQLIEAVWSDGAPSTARAQIQADVSALRTGLRDAGGTMPLVTRSRGYVLEIAQGQLDHSDFLRLATSARKAANPRTGAELLREALDLWQGTPLADIDAAYTPGARARLEEQRLEAYEQLVDMELALGRHFEVTAELAGTVAEHPLRERLRCQLMLALHRGGRRADALALARGLRRLLADQQGLDPGTAIVELERRILRADPALEATPWRTATPERQEVYAGAGVAGRR